MHEGFQPLHSPASSDELESDRTLFAATFPTSIAATRRDFVNALEQNQHTHLEAGNTQEKGTEYLRDLNSSSEVPSQLLQRHFE